MIRIAKNDGLVCYRCQDSLQTRIKLSEPIDHDTHVVRWLESDDDGNVYVEEVPNWVVHVDHHGVSHRWVDGSLIVDDGTEANYVLACEVCADYNALRSTA